MDIINTTSVAEAIFFNTYFKFGKNNMDNTTANGEKSNAE